MVTTTTDPSPATRNHSRRETGQEAPERRTEATPARYRPARASTSTSTGRSSDQDDNQRVGVKGGSDGAEVSSADSMHA